MAKIEAKEVLDAIERHRQINHDCIVPKSDESVAFARGFDMALDHIREIVNVLNVGAELLEALQKGADT